MCTFTSCHINLPYLDNSYGLSNFNFSLQIEVKVDDTLRAEDSTGGSFGRLTTRGEVFIGGAPEPAELVGSTVGENFFGNLQDVSKSVCEPF